MDVIEAIRTRRSIRVFKPDPIPKMLAAGHHREEMCNPGIFTF